MKGRFEQRFHEHVAALDLAEKRVAELLRTLVLRNEAAAGERIVSAYLMHRGRAATSLPDSRDLPGTGVIRSYCVGGDAIAWADWVVDPMSFRRNSERSQMDAG